MRNERKMGNGYRQGNIPLFEDIVLECWRTGNYNTSSKYLFNMVRHLQEGDAREDVILPKCWEVLRIF